jgi:hypothetical protein
MTVEVADAHAHVQSVFSSQNGDRDWGVYYARTAFCCALLWTKGRNAKTINKEMFRVYGGKCSSGKAAHKWAEKHDKPFTDDEEFKTEVGKWPRQKSKDALVKRWDKRINVRGGSVEKQIFFRARISHALHFVSVCDIYWLSLVTEDGGFIS